MNCSEACTLASQKLRDSITPADQAALDSHFNECRSCTAWSSVMFVAEAWKAAEDGDPTLLRLVEYSNRENEYRSQSGDRLSLESCPADGSVEDMDEWFVAQPTEWNFLSNRRAGLRRIVTQMESLAAQTGSKVVADSLRRLKEHIRWADELAIASGVPSECVYPSSGFGSSGES